jgi:hypothetical protein
MHTQTLHDMILQLSQNKPHLTRFQTDISRQQSVKCSVSQACQMSLNLSLASTLPINDRKAIRVVSHLPFIQQNQHATARKI